VRNLREGLDQAAVVAYHDRIGQRRLGPRPPGTTGQVRTLTVAFRIHLRDSRAAARGGFTLIEMLLVVAIVGILAGLLMPAVQAAREAARRAQCTNNLRQIGLAVMNYHDGHGSLPSGYLSSVSNTGAEIGPGWGWIAQMLPQLEEASLAASLDLRQPIESAVNKNRWRLIGSLLCPSNDLDDWSWPAETRDPDGTPTGLICNVGFAAYVGMYGSTDTTPIGDGLFFRNSRVRWRNVTDGSSQTILAGERAYRLGEATWVGAVTGASLFPDSDEGEVAVPHLKPSSGMILGHAGQGNTPNSPTSEINQFYSLHGDGANFVFADGHVVFLEGTIDYSLYRGLATRAGSEVVAP
jgi:prepilin-type N-terminal cleavage/methylation domain-containing protein/prepilin-type processing-associated H-X9-DG protein